MNKSDAIEQLLSKPERLKVNLSSHQTISVLDHQLYRALQPICLTTNIVPIWLSELLPLLIFDTRRKVSAVKLQRLVNLGFSAIMSKKRGRQFRFVQEMRIERNLIFSLLDKVYTLTKGYRELQIAYCKTRKISKRVLIADKMFWIERCFKANRVHFLPALVLSRWWSDLARDYKSMIAQKYYKLAYGEARKAVRGTQMHVDFEELFKNYILAIDRAIDKYDSSRGALTSYLLYWLKNANINPDFDHQYGISYTMPNSRRRELQKQGWVGDGGAEQNLSHNIEDNLDVASVNQIPLYDFLEAQKRMKSLRGLREIRWVMLTAGVNYQLSPSEIEALAQTMKD